MTKYYTDQNDTIRRGEPRVRMSKKQRIKKRWEGKEEERFSKTGRGHINHDELDKVKAYMRAHPEGVTAIEVAKFADVSQARAARLLDLLSGDVEDNENMETDFLIYADDENPPNYFIAKDREGTNE